MQSNRFQTLDCLRGIAALFVVLFHLGGAVLPRLSTPTTAMLTGWGWSGVELFFVISGFVIPQVMLQSNYEWRASGRFLLKRFVRIWPPSALVVVLTVLQYSAARAMQNEGGQGSWTFTTGQLIANSTYLVPFTSYQWLNGVFWTLAVEFQYYLLLALAFPLICKNRASLLATFLACVAAVWLPGGKGLFPHYAVYFAIGAMTLLRVRSAVSVRAFLGALICLSAAAAISQGWLAALVATSGALLMAFTKLDSRPLLFLGKISYSLYLTHILTASVSEYLYVRLVAPSTPLARLVGQGLCLAATIVGAWLFYLVVERFFLSASQALSRRPESGGSEAAVRERSPSF